MTRTLRAALEAVALCAATATLEAQECGPDQQVQWWPRRLGLQLSWEA
jgi:hypothetical protein